MNIDEEGVLHQDKNYLISFVAECEMSGSVVNRFGNQVITTDSIDSTAIKNIRERLENRHKGCRIAILNIMELADD